MSKYKFFIILLLLFQPALANDALIEELFKNNNSNVQVHGEGVVTRLLPDDIKGSRHQKFILRLKSGHTILISHNIDIAPKIESIAVSDKIEFYGEYEWNAKGGVVHWTHKDPRGMHVDGWLIHHGKKYE